MGFLWTSPLSPREARLPVRLHEIYHKVYHMTANNKTQLILCHDSSIVVNNGQQPPAMSARQLSLNFIHLNIAYFLPARRFAFVSVRPSVCLSQAGVVSKRLKGSTGFGTAASLGLSYTVLEGNSGISKIRLCLSGILS